MTQIILQKQMDNINDLAYRISNLNQLTWTVNTPVSPMPLPEESHEENMLIKMEGNSATMSISWTLVDSTDFGVIGRAADTTVTPNVTANPNIFTEGDSLTVYEQISQFREEFVPKSIGDGYRLLIMDDAGNELLADFGTIASMRFNVSGDSPIVWEVSLEFMVGNVIALLEADIPERPDEIIMESPSSGSINVNWKAFSGYAGTPEPITGYKIKYKLNNSPWEIVEGTTSGITGTETLTGLTAGNYRVTFGLKNANSEEASVVYLGSAWTDGSAGAKSKTLVVS